MNKKVTLKDWIVATRPWSFPASAIPALVTVAYVFYLSRIHGSTDINWLNGFLAVLGAVVFQASGNLISDYFDYKYGVDREETYGSSRLLVDGIFLPATILRFGTIILSIGSLIGVYLLLRTGMPLLFIGLFGIISTFFYYMLKYRAMGDLLIFVVYGMLIALGTIFVMTGQFHWEILLISAPVGFLIVNILHANNTRDMIFDKQAGIKTQAMSLGVTGSQTAYLIMNLSAYLLIVVVVIMKILPILSLLVFLTLPLSIKNIKQMKMSQIDRLEIIKDLDANSAKLVLAFGLLLVIANFVSAFL